MNAIKRPVAVLIVSCLYIGVGVVGFAYHFPELVALARDSVWIELTELLAIICGAFMLAAETGRAGWRSCGWLSMWLSASRCWTGCCPLFVFRGNCLDSLPIGCNAILWQSKRGR